MQENNHGVRKLALNSSYKKNQKIYMLKKKQGKNRVASKLAGILGLYKKQKKMYKWEKKQERKC